MSIVDEARPEPRRHADTLQRLDRLAEWLDAAVRIPGTSWRIGFDAIVGLIPGIGDVAGAAVALYLVRQAWRCGIPLSRLGHMLFNLAMDAALGSIPVIGDVFDLAWKANRRNVELLRSWLADPR